MAADGGRVGAAWRPVASRHGARLQHLRVALDRRTRVLEARFCSSGLVIQSDAQVLKTRAMVARDWQRSVAEPRSVSCIRHTLAKQLPSNERLVSFGRHAFPKLAQYSAAYRMLVRVHAQGQTVDVVIDL